MADAKVAKKASAERAQALSYPTTPKAEIELTVNALKVLEKRYLKKDNDSRPVERPQDMFGGWHGRSPLWTGSTTQTPT